MPQEDVLAITMTVRRCRSEKFKTAETDLITNIIIIYYVSENQFYFYAFVRVACRDRRARSSFNNAIAGRNQTEKRQSANL